MNFADQHSGSKISFNKWLEKLKRANWRVPADIKNFFDSADLLGRGSNRVVFDVGGNNYRMICAYKFSKNMIHLFVCWIGSHAEYDKVCDESKQYSISVY